MSYKGASWVDLLLQHISQPNMSSKNEWLVIKIKTQNGYSSVSYKYRALGNAGTYQIKFLNHLIKKLNNNKII